jgi:succinate dehydrogenase (ubiquinone) cytochrome b560 subunit
MYLYGLTYLVAPTLGLHVESASLAAAFAAWPLIAQLAVKFVYALPFTFHSLNGVRHLVWDTASAISNKQVIQTGWTVIGLSVVTALGLAFWV